MNMQEAVTWSEKLALKGRYRTASTGLPIRIMLKRHTGLPYPTIHRKDQYEGLKAKMQLPEWLPDYGPNDWGQVSTDRALPSIGAGDITGCF